MSEHRPIVNRIHRSSRESNVNARHSTDDSARELAGLPLTGAGHPATDPDGNDAHPDGNDPAGTDLDAGDLNGSDLNGSLLDYGLEPAGTPLPRSGDPDLPVENDLDDDLDQDPFDDDLAAELDARAPRPKITRLTLALAGGLLLVIGFVGGSLAQRHWGSASTASPTANGANRAGGNFPGGLGASGAPGGFTGRNGGGASGAASAPITGTVKLVDGSTVYIVTSDGQVITVKTSGSTTVQTSQAGKLSDLATGSTVTINGQTGTDGSVTANSITKTR